MKEWLDQLEQLARLMSQRGVTVLELRANGAHVRMSRAAADTPPPHVESMPPLFMAGYGEPSPAHEETPQSEWQPPGPIEVRSPMVGYCTLQPIELGSRVERGQTIATIQVLGIPNDVPAPITGTLVGWQVGNGEPVEYGQPIALIQPLTDGE
jgi:acetyl-CoA carboxylase biotin carboxyl carrier protein